jgi:transcriptional regulator with XRE-family HTH domain
LDTLGKRIKYLRETQGITQKYLAEAVGIREATLSRYENDKRDNQWQILGKLAEKLNTSTDYLMGLTENILPVKLIDENGKISQEYYDLVLQFEKLSNENKIRIKERIKTLLDI